MKPDTQHINNLNRNSSTVTINGKLYDVATGRLLESPASQMAVKVRSYGSFDIKPAGTVHAGPARSTALRREAVTKPVSAMPVTSRPVRTVRPHATHPSVSRFAAYTAPGRPQDADVATAHVVRPSDILSSLNRDDANERPIGLATQVQNYTPASQVRLVHHKAHTKPRTSRPPSHAVTAHQVAHAPSRAAKNTAARTSVESRWKKFQKRVRLTPPVIITGIIIGVLIASAICYLTIPTLSLFVAAKSAGVEASYPNYVPAGYHFKGPVSYGEGTVKTEFVGSGASRSFTIVQKNTTWDSGAVLDNYVLAKSPDYLTYSQGGITVYTFGSQAAWVNAGVLHTIEGNANLTSDQILRIAGSM